jgi:hypothetical protein
LAEEQSYDRDLLRQIWERDYPGANTEQKHIIDSITSADDNGNADLSFIQCSSPGGTGKTYVENLVLVYVCSHGSARLALAVASSGIASILLDGGRTSHSRFQIPLDIIHDSIYAVNINIILPNYYDSSNSSSGMKRLHNIVIVLRLWIVH